MSARKLLRIARWEVATSTGTIDRKTVAVLLVALLAAAAGAPAITSGAGQLDAGLYTVAVDDEHPYSDAIESRDSLRIVDSENRADLVVTDGDVRVADGTSGDAALSELRDAIRSYNNRNLREEDDQAAAFPVFVDLEFVEEAGTTIGEDGTSDGDTTGDGTSDGTGDTTGDGSGTDGGGSGETDGSADDSDGTTDDGSIGGSTGSSDGRLPVPDVGVGGSGAQSGTPGDISAPFPFASLVLAFLFVLPMNFVIQAYGSTIMDERRNRRGELLLVAPVTRTDVVGGKTLPYVGGIAAVTVTIAALVGGGPLSVLAVMPIGLLFLGLTFVAAMFARSYKELTFLTVSISVFVTSFVFVPAIFTDVTPIALISPLTLVVIDLKGSAVDAGGVLFATGPSLLASGVLFGLGIGIYREEDMFTQVPVHGKALDALAAWIHRPRHVAAMTALFIPFVFVLELLAVAVLFALPLAVSLPAILVLVAVVEEVAKSLHVFAAFEHDRFDRALPTALGLGLASGAGFFLAEKATHAIQLVGLDQLEVGQAAFAPSTGVGPALAVALFLAPLVLHGVTAAISAVGASENAKTYGSALAVAILVHAGYNLGVILLVA
ncbi:sodium ABC transporter permease [Salinarchaeum sp. Harcht-Bsk1]|uniref:ABC transporter permease n=1 Tax=Salinarchaeum sp. Harcht-Bsk1 TaxID=1333523 RepID=UPI0003422C38|nr:ABC transporter permease [Salinarchaeum sp. Harcht-Bsk1]AGN01050.1 sodium ABC transporter permease [Salinarchaeum sp. Harcht-Bsk1]